MEDTPDFSFDPATRPYRAGVRPYRKETFRLEPDRLGDKFLVHNYGHGGAGITMSWGCAAVVRDMVCQHGAGDGVAVIGAGVMGLTVATLLAEVQPRIAVTVYADKFTPRTTSDVAGGQWAPSLVKYRKHDSAAKQAFFDILRKAKAEHERRGRSFGVSRRPNYTPRPLAHVDDLPDDIVPARTRLPRLPFARLTKPGYRYDLLLVEPPILMRKLKEDLAAAGVCCVEKRFPDASSLAELAERVIVNCTGLGSRDLFRDPLMAPIKGQLVFLRPQPNLQYLFSGDGYVFPRSDAVIVGGTEECMVDNETNDDARCIAMVKAAKNLFDGRRFRFLTRPGWLIEGK